MQAVVPRQRIFPPRQHSVLIRNGEAFSGETVSELGIFSVFLRNGGEVIANASVGHLLRTKVGSAGCCGVGFRLWLVTAACRLLCRSQAAMKVALLQALRCWTALFWCKAVNLKAVCILCRGLHAWWLL